MNKEYETSFINALSRYQHKLLRVCSVYSKSDEDQKDLFQEVLIRIWQAMPSFQAKSSLETWMFRITINTCLRFRADLNRKQEKLVYMEHFGFEIVFTGDDDAEQNIRLAQLRQCIKQLNEADKAVTTLYLEELPYREISNITGLSENTIAVKMKRIKKKLLNCLNTY